MRISFLHHFDGTVMHIDRLFKQGNFRGSGGLLVNRKGEVVGTDTAIAARTGGKMETGFDINMAETIMDSREHKDCFGRASAFSTAFKRL